MRFLGHVNVLDAHLERRHARVGDAVVELASDAGAAHEGRVYVRPHEIELGRAASEGAVPARVLRVTPLGSGLKIELEAPALGATLRADLDWERGSALGLQGGEDVFLSLRRARVFLDEAHARARDAGPDELRHGAPGPDHAGAHAAGESRAA
jgi:sulfate/thiosulfate transport system ATP-binding protein